MTSYELGKKMYVDWNWKWTEVECSVLSLFSERRVPPQPPQGPDRLTVLRLQLRCRLPVPTGRSQDRPTDAWWPAHAQWPRHGPCRPGHRGHVSPRPALTNHTCPCKGVWTLLPCGVGWGWGGYFWSMSAKASSRLSNDSTPGKNNRTPKESF